jgi:hypothetical protein
MELIPFGLVIVVAAIMIKWNSNLPVPFCNEEF